MEGLLHYYVGCRKTYRKGSGEKEMEKSAAELCVWVQNADGLPVGHAGDWAGGGSMVLEEPS